MNIAIEPLRQADHHAAINVIKRTITISQGKIYPKELINAFCHKYDFDNFRKRTQEIECFVAKENKNILGIIGLRNNELRTFFVDPDNQGKGIGRKLYDYLENEARKKGIAKLFLQGSPLGEPIYTKFGFKKLRNIVKEKAGVKYTDAYMEKALI